jgi:hypothetical protein
MRKQKGARILTKTFYFVKYIFLLKKARVLGCFSDIFQEVPVTSVLVRLMPEIWRTAPKTLE